MSSLLIGEVAFLVVMAVASILFYRKIRQAKECYDSSRELTKNIVVSFLRELTGVKRRLEHLEVGIKEAAEKSDEALQVSAGIQGEVKLLLDKVEKTAQELVAIKSKIEGLGQEGVAQRKVRDKAVVSSPIPIREEGVLSKLNPTELRVLEILKEEGEMTVPKIRERIGKTREHTARLLKKLYERGFIDRNTRSMPYKYRIRKELKDLLEEGRKQEEVMKEELSK